MIIRGYQIGPLIRKTGRDLWTHDVLGLAAQTAYYFFFSLFPILLFSAPLLSLSSNPQQTMDFLLGKAARAVPPDALGLIRGVLRDIVFTKGAPGVISVGALLTLWAGSNVFSSLMDALNRAFGVVETRPFWKTTLLAMAFVIGAGLAMLVATSLFVLGEPIVHAVVDAIGLGGFAVTLWAVAQTTLSVILVVAVTATVFYVLPDVRLSWREAFLGAAVSTVLWAIATVAFRLYVDHFSSYNQTYGTIGAVIVLMTWMYLSMLAILVGGELASEVHERVGYLSPPGQGVAVDVKHPT